MARVEDGRQAHAGLEGLHDDVVDLVVDDVAVLFEVDGVDDLVASILLITVEILGLTTVT
jgi:hypothetical protein